MLTVRVFGTLLNRKSSPYYKLPVGLRSRVQDTPGERKTLLRKDSIESIYHLESLW